MCTIDVYYGLIHKIWESVSFDFSHPEDRDAYCPFEICTFSWISVDRASDEKKTKNIYLNKQTAVTPQSFRSAIKN